MKLPVRILVVLLALAAPIVHASEASRLLTRMEQAARTLDYDGVFVYQRGDQLDSLRIVHQVRGTMVRERLVALSGAPREIVRSDREVRCYLPDESAVMVEHRRADSRNFPALLPESLTALEANYRLKTGKDGRVAGRKARPVIIKPRDGYRYGYQLWADTETGLLLKASLHDEQGAVIEQYLFTTLSVGKPVADSELEPQTPGKNLVWQRPEATEVATITNRWQAKPPAGYKLTSQHLRKLPGRKQPLTHLVYSDGLSVISAFVEPAGKAPATGLTHMGAVHVYGRARDSHQITVVGEAPAAAVDMIGESLAPAP
jgi:sigma-E factor negative regulatory protein RseB